MADGEASDTGTDPFPSGYWRRHAWKRKRAATREALTEMQHRSTGTPRGAGRAVRVADGSVVPGKRGNVRGGKGP